MLLRLHAHGNVVGLAGVARRAVLPLARSHPAAICATAHRARPLSADAAATSPAGGIFDTDYDMAPSQESHAGRNDTLKFHRGLTNGQRGRVSLAEILYQYCKVD